MIRFKRSIDIQAVPDAVFALVVNLEQRLNLNPGTKVIRIEQESDGPVDVDTIFHIQLTAQNQLVDYRYRCTAFEAGHVFETTSLTDRLFGMRVTIEPIPEGTRLTQEEWLTVEYEKSTSSEAKTPLGKMLNAIADGLWPHPGRPTHS